MSSMSGDDAADGKGEPCAADDNGELPEIGGCACSGDGEPSK